MNQPTNADECMRLIREAIDEPDPARSNRKITGVHYRLGQALQAATGGPSAGANFHSWAVWGSRKAGVTIRQEDLDSAIQNAQKTAGAVGGVIGFGASRVALRLKVRRFPGDVAAAIALGAVCGAAAGRAIAVYSRREASRQILAGNRTVLEDIGAQTVRFLQAFADADAPDAAKLAAFLAGFRPGKTESGGQDLLRECFRQYYIAKFATTDAAQHQALYFGNCLAVLHEHIRLQPCIRGSMPFIIRECVTKRMMTFEVGDRVLAVNEDVTPTGESSYPATLRRLDDAELVTFLYGQQGWDYSGGTTTSAKGAKGAAATDWTRIEQRMAYIVRLFRAYHMDPAVSQKPFAEV